MECGMWIVECGWEMENVENFYEFFFMLLVVIIFWLLYFFCYKVDIILGWFRDYFRDYGKGCFGLVYYMISLWFWEGLDWIIVIIILDKMVEII